ncbi:DUF3443 domain-containing protein [Xylophilus sp. GOD-11R]|uniref:DUF3443 domain-containing protein n=1 Tax=Xylophilus sp. GOD-11R TaxID=3089814 RepID=UPI00298D3AC9|nr:DUF3443 domain-containing protein [Xylophilus sp. GOD-11R]WPB56130.1 DUF3443 domain-containing protein [Xylophilus sp. GOD-11R]
MRSADPTALFSLARLRAGGLALSAALTLALAACGGGGGSDSSSGGGGGSGGGVTASNVVPLVVDSGPPGVSSRIANLPYATVTVCPPGSSSNCRTIDHVLVDTGSTGLRLLASALGTPGNFPLQANTAGAPYAECATFISGYTWGSVRTADVTLGGLTASALPIQVIADPAYPTVPAACSATGSSQNNVADLGANGILGISQFVQDCGAACVNSPIAAAYYACTSGASCTPATAPLTQQITHPIAMMATDNNGSMIQFPAVSASGQVTVAGSLVLGIGTRSNNAVGSAVAYGLDRNTGYLSSAYNGRTYSRTAFDSGSNFYFFSDTSIPRCTGSSSSFYCPASTLTLSAAISGTNGVNGTVSFRIANASQMFTSSNSTAVLPDVGGTIGSTTGFLWGLPFYYGRSVFTAVIDRSTPLGNGPYVAF